MPPSKLVIKIRSLERLLKEQDYYKNELLQQQKIVNDLKDNPESDPYDLKKQIEVLKDTERIFPTLYNKIDEFKQDLTNYLESNITSTNNVTSTGSIDENEYNAWKSKIDQVLKESEESIKNID
ncbi:related to Tubulin-specific chaperone A [Saccharomycodes ludwigii]|uniref:Tubulin-specific chaperone A n=1 Tax=Saccharomycodes ludwigii TaxID=36035 RepID=A0A376B0W6_9ASCO|nr:hypothetical protein SCDLUD_002199 [Saccharomycodes ludwigii]KAH3902379.1 hypothetical protein SCDLUD_002199 [Saccharomycodes ludwigii]SSD58318.1 related to Tubulin-specific chaperone A [Saccharomycodes ludwigii]